MNGDLQEAKTRARLAHGSTFQMLTVRSQRVLSHVGGQLPGVDPDLTTASMSWTYLVRGKNPYDSLRGRELLFSYQFKASGAPAVEQLLKETWNGLGGTVTGRFQDAPMTEPDPGALESHLKLPGISNLVGRWVTVSNRGQFDQDRNPAGPIAEVAARRREVVRSVIQKKLTNPP